VPDSRVPLAQLRQRVVRNPVTAVAVFLATIYLAALPTIYTVLTAGLDPTKSDAAGWRKLALPLLVPWIVSALLVGAVAFLKDSELQRLADFVRSRPPSRLSRRRREAVLRAITLLLENGREAQLLRSFSPRIFVASPPENPTELVPFLSEDIRTWQHWPIGMGAIGLTFRTNSDDPLVFRHAQLARLNRTLTVEQLERYEHLTMVAAIVIRDDQDKALGVLSVSSTAPSPRFGQSRLEAMKLLSGILGVFLELTV
jgi:hypothetical protein